MSIEQSLERIANTLERLTGGQLAIQQEGPADPGVVLAPAGPAQMPSPSESILDPVPQEDTALPLPQTLDELNALAQTVAANAGEQMDAFITYVKDSICAPRKVTHLRLLAQKQIPDAGRLILDWAKKAGINV